MFNRQSISNGLSLLRSLARKAGTGKAIAVGGAASRLAIWLSERI